MLTAFAMGAMNMLWMSLLTVLVCAEKLAPARARVATLTGAGFLVWGAALLI
jgi:predicted metal-binding membrane protein